VTKQDFANNNPGPQNAGVSFAIPNAAPAEQPGQRFSGLVRGAFPNDPSPAGPAALRFSGPVSAARLPAGREDAGVLSFLERHEQGQFQHHLAGAQPLAVGGAGTSATPAGALPVR
jgi:hypothetical protein